MFPPSPSPSVGGGNCNSRAAGGDAGRWAYSFVDQVMIQMSAALYERRCL